MSQFLPNVFSPAASTRPCQSGQNEESRGKMTCRTPSSASSRSTGSSSSGVSSNSAGSSAGDWHQSISVREIHKTGRVCLLVDKKGIFWKNDQRKDPYWCVFCIHEECYPFLELYEDHKSSLSHQALKVISLIDCQHVSPNISLADDKQHSFTVTLATEIYQFSAGSQADMHDWIATLRTRLQDLQGSEPSKNNYTRCPLPCKSERLLTPDPTYLRDQALQTETRLVVELPERANSPRKSPTPRVPGTGRTPERRPSPLPSNLACLSQSCTLSQPLASPPACEAPPVPSDPVAMPPPVPPRGVRHMRSVPHPLLTANIPPPPPPRPAEANTEAFNKPPRPPRKEDKANNAFTDVPTKDLHAAVQMDGRLGQSHHQLDAEPLICLADEPGMAGTGKGAGHSDEYGTLFQRRRSPQLSCTRALRPPVEVATDHKRETRSQTASPALSERSFTSTASEPSIETPPLRSTTRTAAISTISATSNNQPRTLRQQQVERLKEEMSDPSGVKVRVRRKDCLTALALVDCFGCVWVAGWKQKEHPHFHSLFHLGDQVLAVNGIYVSKSADVFCLLKDCPDKQHVVFTLNRIPRGQVFVLERQHDGQDLGLIREGNTAEVKSVLPDGLATQHGLPAKAITCDGNTLCNWVITEINHRPLNWFFKDNEIDDRLKAVGKEISILVQPSDLVNTIKKQFRTLRNYRDFIVQ